MTPWEDHTHLILWCCAVAPGLRRPGLDCTLSVGVVASAGPDLLRGGWQGGWASEGLKPEHPTTSTRNHHWGGLCCILTNAFVSPGECSLLLIVLKHWPRVKSFQYFFDLVAFVECTAFKTCVISLDFVFFSPKLSEYKGRINLLACELSSFMANEWVVMAGERTCTCSFSC